MDNNARQVMDWNIRKLYNKWDYAANYSSSYTSRSLVDKGYVQSAVSASSTLASVLARGNDANSIGINNIGNIRNATGNATTSMWMQTPGYWELFTYNNSNTGRYAGFETYGGNADPYSFIVAFSGSNAPGTDGKWVGVTVSSNAVVVEKNSYNVNQLFPGITYAADYSANFTNRSLIDKGTVLTYVSQSYRNQNATGSLNSGLRLISTNPTGSYRSAFYNYTIRSGSNSRAGQYIAVWNANVITGSDRRTGDIGITNNVILSSSIVNSKIQLTTVLPSNGWTIKTNVNFL
jgi:hypothetical protein